MFNLSSLKKSMSLITFVSLTVGCTATDNIQLSQTDLSLLDGKSVVFVSREAPGFITYITSNSDASDFPQGRINLNDLNIKSPAHTVGEKLVADLTQRFGLSATVVNEPLTLDNSEAFLATRYGADYILDSEIQSWSIVQQPFGWGRYNLDYSSQVRLIDAKTSKVISQGSCNNVIEYNEGFSNQKLLDKNAKGLKAVIKKATDKCFEEFKQYTFNV
jgi:hypothetical protein